MLALLAPAFITLSCNKKDAYMGFTPGKAAPTISSVYTYSKTLYNDTTVKTTQSYDTLGNLTTTTDTIIGNTTTGLDSVTTTGNLNNYYVIHGSNLGAATAVFFNGTRAYFNRALGTDQTIVVQIPSTTPYRKPLAIDTLTVTTLYGTAKFHFTVLAPPPTINATNGVSDYDFNEGSIDTLYGVGFASTTNVYVKGISTSSASKGITDKATIVSVNDTVMIVKFPQTNITQGNLLFAYTQTDGTKDTSVSTTIFNNMDNAYQILGQKTTADPTQSWAAVFQNNGVYTGWVANGWSSWSASTSVVKGTSTSFYAKYDNGGWKVAGFQFNTGFGVPALAYDPSYQYLSFWVINTGAAVTQTAYIQWGDNVFGQNKINPITIEPNGWQFFKIPISSLNWDTGKTPWSANSSLSLRDVGFFLTCQDAQGHNIGEADLFFTNVVLLK